MFDPDAYEAALDAELALLRERVLHSYPGGWNARAERRAMRQVLSVDLGRGDEEAVSHPALQILGTTVMGGLVAERLRIRELRAQQADG